MTNYYSLGSHLPQYAVEIAFESDPTDTTQVWTDVSQDVVSFSTRRGRQDELGRTEAGTASFVFENYERRYDPELNGQANLFENPWFQTDTTSWATGSGNSIARSSNQQLTGTHSLECTYGGTGETNIGFEAAESISADTDYIVGCALYIPTATTITDLDIRSENFDILKIVNADINKRDEWQWVFHHIRSTTDLDGNPLVLRGSGLVTNDVVYLDHAFLFTAPASPFTGNLRPMKRIRVRAEFGGTEYDVWHGLITGWGNRWEGAGGIPLVEIQAVDLFRVLSSSDYTFNETGNLNTGDYIDNRLDQVSWPAGDRSIDTGLSVLGPVDSQIRNMLSEIQAAAEAEQGVFYVSGAGVATFRDRLTKLEDSTTSQAAFSDMVCAQTTPNNGFDAGTSGWLAQGTGVTLTWDPDVDRLDRPWSGSAYVDFAGGHGAHDGIWENLTAQRHSCQQGDVLYVEAWVLPDGFSGTAELQLLEFAATVYQGVVTSPTFSVADGTWNRLWFTYTIQDPDTDSARIDVAPGDTDVKAFWVDDVSVSFVRGTGVIPIANIQPEYDDNRLINHVDVTWQGGTESADDSTSQTSYMQRSTQISTGLAFAGGAAGIAESMVYTYKDPHTRISSVTVDTADDGGTEIDDILGLELLERVSIRRTPPGHSQPITLDGFVEGINHDVEKYRWETTLDLSPDPYADDTFLVLDDATDGKLDSGNLWAP